MAKTHPPQAMKTHPPAAADDLLGIGELARRTGLSVAAIRFYESRGLLTAARSAGNQRRFRRSDIRRLSFARIAQQLGLSLEEIQAVLGTLPAARTPTRQDWAVISAAISARLQAQIGMLERMRARLDGCIGCGCLSLDRCAIYNAGDHAAQAGPGPRFLLDPG